MVTHKRHEHKKTYYNDIGLRLAEQLLGLKHLHYGYFGDGLEPSLANLPRAQEAYVEHLLEYIPADVKRVCDVGCGTGGVAKALVDRNYQVVCLAPDPYLIEKTKENTGGRVKTIPDLYENVEELEDESFDLVLMSESCQYVNVDEGWKQHQRLVRPGGYVLVSDFFKWRDLELANISKSGHVVDNYLAAAESAGFELLREEDITDKVAPTMDIYQELIHSRVFPVAEAAFEFLNRRYPKVYKLLKWRLGGKVLKLREKYNNQSAEIFKKHKGYLVFLFRKSNIH